MIRARIGVALTDGGVTDALRVRIVNVSAIVKWRARIVEGLLGNASSAQEPKNFLLSSSRGRAHDNGIARIIARPSVIARHRLEAGGVHRDRHCMSIYRLSAAHQARNCWCLP